MRILLYKESERYLTIKQDLSRLTDDQAMVFVVLAIVSSRFWLGCVTFKMFVCFFLLMADFQLVIA